MSSVIEAIVNGDIVYEVTLDQPASIYEVTISDTAPNYEVIEFDPGMLSLALIQDSSPSSVKTYSSTKIESMIGIGLTTADIGTTVQSYDADLTSWAGIAPSAKQDTLTFDLVPTDASTNPVQSNGIFDALAGKQETLVSGTNIKTINSTSLLGSGDIVISGGSSTLTIDNKTTAYTVVDGDLGKIINCTSGTFTVSLTAAATLGTGFNCWVWNTSTSSGDIITIDPDTTETIEGKTSWNLKPSEGAQIISGASGWYLGSKKTMKAYSENVYSTSHLAPVASGANAIAIGMYSTASGTSSVALGGGSSASATSTAVYSVAIGSKSSSTSNYSCSIGTNSGATGSQAVTGAGAMALGGSYASGTDSFAAAIANNTSTYGATGANSVAIGSTAKASGSTGIAIGKLALASGSGSIAISSATGYGYGATATGVCSVAIGDCATSTIAGKYAFASYCFLASGDAQLGKINLIGITIDATPKVLTSNNTTAGTTNQVILLNNTAYTFTGTVISKQSASTNVASWKIEGVIVRGTTAGSTTLVASTVTAISNIPAWTLALSADTTNGGLAVTFTGAAATNIRTVATIETSEVIYA